MWYLAAHFWGNLILYCRQGMKDSWMRLFLFGFCVCVCVCVRVCVCVFESCVYAQHVFSVLIVMIISFCSLYCDIAQCHELMICSWGIALWKTYILFSSNSIGVIMMFVCVFFQGRLVNLSCSSVPSFVVSITATTQVGDWTLAVVVIAFLLAWGLHTQRHCHKGGSLSYTTHVPDNSSCL